MQMGRVNRNGIRGNRGVLALDLLEQISGDFDPLHFTLEEVKAEYAALSDVESGTPVYYDKCFCILEEAGLIAKNDDSSYCISERGSKSLVARDILEQVSFDFDPLHFTLAEVEEYAVVPNFGCGTSIQYEACLQLLEEAGLISKNEDSSYRICDDNFQSIKRVNRDPAMGVADDTIRKGDALYNALVDTFYNVLFNFDRLA
jgi:repressor of nif and glnA expression